MDLSSQTICIPCSDLPLLSEQAMSTLKSQIPDWDIVIKEKEMHLRRVFPFDDFELALDFTQHVGHTAEEIGHHPTMLTEWGQVTIEWWTHALRGLTANDFIMAAKTDQISNHTLSRAVLLH